MPFERLAEAIGRFVLKNYVEPRMAKTVSFYRAEVTAAASGGKITIKRPFDNTSVTLPCTTAASNLAVGSQCIVLLLGSSSNGVVFSDGMMSDIGSGGGTNVSVSGTQLVFT